MDLPSSGGLTVNLMSARTGNYAGTQVDDKSGEYLVYGETGEFYLSVFPSNSYGDKPWTIQIKTPNSQTNQVTTGSSVTFRGTGSTTTLPFTVDSNPWIMDLPSSGGLTVNLMSARTGNYAGTQVDDKSGEYVVYGETGEFYLSVFPSNSYGDKPWTIQIKTP
jgi:hypothetical protein